MVAGARPLGAIVLLTFPFFKPTPSSHSSCCSAAGAPAAPMQNVVTATPKGAELKKNVANMDYEKFLDANVGDATWEKVKTYLQGNSGSASCGPVPPGPRASRGPRPPSPSCGGRRHFAHTPQKWKLQAGNANAKIQDKKTIPPGTGGATPPDGTKFKVAAGHDASPTTTRSRLSSSTVAEVAASA